MISPEKAEERIPIGENCKEVPPVDKKPTIIHTRGICIL